MISKYQKILFFCLVVFFIRLVFSVLPSFDIDMNTWLGWAYRLREVGMAGFYSDVTWTQYTPGFLYWLWFIGRLGFVNELAIKIPVILADIGTGLIIWKIVKTKSEKLAYLSFLLYVISPVVIFTGSVWGQIDGIFTFFLLGSAYALIFTKKPNLSAIAWAIAFLIKPQALAFLIPTIFLMFIHKYKLKNYLSYIATSLVTIFVASIPFFPGDPLLGLVHLIVKMTGFYNYTSVFAFNFWALVGMWKPDATTFMGLSYYVWGLVIYLASILLILVRFKKSALKPDGAFLVFSLTFLASFLFPTRVHERYLFPFFAFLLASAGLARSRFLVLIYLLMNFLNLINLYHPYAYYSDNFLRNETLLAFTGNLSVTIALAILVILPVIIFVNLKKIDERLSFLKFKSAAKNTKRESVLEIFPKIELTQKQAKLILLGILLFSFATRIIALTSPSNEYFDEVYHAFTARAMLHGDPKAWEWWNTPPEGFAYEWTHPPVAKLGMVAGMAILGENAFGWRFPGAILGVISIYLVYLIAKHIFKDEVIGILASAIMALDGLTLVMSRIGMNDIYMLTFSLASLYFFLKNRNFRSAVFLGLALASKWSALWLIPIIFVAHFVFRKKLRIEYLWFVLLPPLIYLGSYLPFFVQGHSFKQFFNVDVFNCIGKTSCTYEFGLQQQMWWYHTNLKATHAYTSPWWSWPLNIRPVYLYTSDVVQGLVARIYLIGNPMVLWMGLTAVITTFILFVKNFTKRGFTPQVKKIGFVIFSYLIFFVPWAASPRIMFLYHYLPSIPFMAIITAYILRKYPKLIPAFLFTSLLMFVYFYPHWAGLKVPEWLDLSYYWFSSWR